MHNSQCYLSHTDTMERWEWKALWNEGPNIHELNSAFELDQNLVIRSRKY